MTVQTSGSITFELRSNGEAEPIVLYGVVGNQIQVGFRAKDGDKEVKIGTFTSVIGSVASSFGLPDFQERFEARLTELEQIGPLIPIVSQLRTAQLYVTDMALTAQYDEGTDSYVVQSVAFGFRVEFSNLTLGPIGIAGFGVLFEYSQDGNDNLTSIPG